MNQLPLYPMRFEPIFQYRLWGGRRLADILSTPLPGDKPIGEAWILSDRDDFSSQVSNGALTNRTLTQLMEDFPDQMMGALAENYPRFPLLLKFLDASEMLSVQVHPSDAQTELLPPGERGKTEAWVVLETDSRSQIYAGLSPETTPDTLRRALAGQTLGQFLPSFTPKPGDAVFIPAGTVHTLGGGVVVFEVQENSDVTFRLSDWNRIDPKTGKSRELSVDKAFESIDFKQGVDHPVIPVVLATEPAHRERLFQCNHFGLNRILGEKPFSVGMDGEPRVLVCLEGSGQVEHDGADYDIGKGDVMLLPASIGECTLRPSSLITVLEISIPDLA